MPQLPPKQNCHTKLAGVLFLLTSTQFETVHNNIVGPLLPAIPYNRKYSSLVRYILTCIDKTTRWIEATPMQVMTVAILSFVNA